MTQKKKKDFITSEPVVNAFRRFFFFFSNAQVDFLFEICTALYT